MEFCIIMIEKFMNDIDLEEVNDELENIPLKTEVFLKEAFSRE